MAYLAQLGALTDELVTIITSTSPDVSELHFDTGMAGVQFTNALLLLVKCQQIQRVPGDGPAYSEV